MIVEDGSELVAELWGTAHPAASAILCYPEGCAALAAALRGGRLTRRTHRRALAAFESLQGELSLIGIDTQLARRAGELAETFALRGYDAVHLASALAADGAVTFVTWDRDLKHAAARSGCAVAPADPL